MGNSGPLQEQRPFVTVEPPLQPLSSFLKGPISKYSYSESLSWQILGKHKLSRVETNQTKTTKHTNNWRRCLQAGGGRGVEEKIHLGGTDNQASSREWQRCPLTLVQNGGETPWLLQTWEWQLQICEFSQHISWEEAFSHGLYNCFCSGQKCHGNYFLKALLGLGPAEMLSTASSRPTLSFSLDRSSLGRADFQTAFVQKSLGNTLWMTL